MADYTATSNLISKVLDFVQFGGARLGSNQRPAGYKPAALPTELRGLQRWEFRKATRQPRTNLSDVSEQHQRGGLVWLG